MKKTLAFVLFISLLIVSGCKRQSDEWVGFYYPSGSVEDGHEVKEFTTKDQCETWANEKIKNATDASAHYYCGYECTYDDQGQYLCGGN